MMQSRLLQNLGSFLPLGDFISGHNLAQSGKRHFFLHGHVSIRRQSLRPLPQLDSRQRRRLLLLLLLLLLFGFGSCEICHVGACEQKGVRAPFVRIEQIPQIGFELPQFVASLIADLLQMPHDDGALVKRRRARR